MAVRIWTHDGRFHTDEVFAVALLNIIHKDEVVEVVRSRNPQEGMDYVVDVGMQYDNEKNLFDHHQVGTPYHDSGVRYAAFGMVYEKFGRKLISDLVPDIISKEQQFLGNRLIDEVFIIMSAFVEAIDAVDNGEYEWVGKTRSDTLQDVIKSFYPTTDDPSDTEVDARFIGAVRFAEFYIINKIMILAKEFLYNEYVASEIRTHLETDERILVLRKSGTFMPEVMRHLTYSSKICFIVYPGNNGAWCVRSVPLSKDSPASRYPAPSEWCAQSTDDLVRLTGVDEVTFVHLNGFMATASSFEGAIKLAKVWLSYATN